MNSSNIRRKKKKEDLRNEILDAARELFVAHGYENVSMRRIAEMIGYTPTTIYLYFDDKAALLREVCEETFRRLSDAITKTQVASTDPLDALRKGMLAYIVFGLQHPHHYEVAFVQPNKRFFSLENFSFEQSMGRRAFELLSNSVADCMAAGVIRQGDVALAAQTLWAGIHGITSLLITHDGFPFVKKPLIFESVVDTMIAGLKT